MSLRIRTYRQCFSCMYTQSSTKSGVHRRPPFLAHASKTFPSPRETESSSYRSRGGPASYSRRRFKKDSIRSELVGIGDACWIIPSPAYGRLRNTFEAPKAPQ